MILGRCHAGVLASVRAMTSSHQRFGTLVHGARPQADWRSLERHAETWRQLDGVQRQRRVCQEPRQVNTLHVGTSPASHRIASHRTALPPLRPTLPVRRRRDRSTPTDDSSRNVASGCSVRPIQAAQVASQHPILLLLLHHHQTATRPHVQRHRTRSRC